MRPKNTVVLVEPYGMGDIVSMQPLVAELQRAGWNVVACGQPRWRPILEGVEWVDIPASWQDMRPIGFLRFLRRSVVTMRDRYQRAIGIDPRGDIRSILLLHLIGCSKVLSLDHYFSTTIRIPAGVAQLIPDTSEHKMRWEVALGFAAALGIPNTVWTPPRMQRLGKDAAPQARRIGIITIAPWKGKLWSPDKWCRIVENLRDRHLDPILICGPGQEDAARKQAGVTDIDILMAKDVPNLAQIIGSCEALITLDSGPMHLACAMEKPVIALFGTGQLPLWAPCGQHVKAVISPLFPESRLHQVEENLSIGVRNMSMIPVEDVMQAFWETYGQFMSSTPRSNVIH